MSYDSTRAASTRSAYRGVAGQSMGYYETGANVSFTEQEKAEAGDKFAPVAKAGEGTGGAAPVGEDGGGDKSLVDRVDL